MQASAIDERLKTLTGGENTVAPIYLYNPDCQTVDETPDLGTQKGRDVINEFINQTQPKVIFVDNISTFVRTGSENEAESWSPIQGWAIQQRKNGRAVIFVHHANKGGHQRGSHKKEDVMDTVIKLSRPDDYIEGLDETAILIEYTKARHLKNDEQKSITARLKTTDETSTWTSEIAESSFEHALALLKEGKLNQSEIADIVNVSKGTISKWRRTAISQQLI